MGRSTPMRRARALSTSSPFLGNLQRTLLLLLLLLLLLWTPAARVQPLHRRKLGRISFSMISPMHVKPRAALSSVARKTNSNGVSSPCCSRFGVRLPIWLLDECHRRRGQDHIDILQGLCLCVYSLCHWSRTQTPAH